jgi:hypothetical protein
MIIGLAKRHDTKLASKQDRLGTSLKRYSQRNNPPTLAIKDSRKILLLLVALGNSAMIASRGPLGHAASEP